MPIEIFIEKELLNQIPKGSFYLFLTESHFLKTQQRIRKNHIGISGFGDPGGSSHFFAWEAVPEADIFIAGPARIDTIHRAEKEDTGHQKSRLKNYLFHTTIVYSYQ